MSREFSTILYSALSACFGLNHSSSEASVLLREAYQDPENAPRPPRNTDVIWYSAAPDPAAAEAPPACAADLPSQASHVPLVSSFSAWTLTVVCYGPRALTYARKIRSFLFADGAGFPREILRKAGIRPVPGPPEPMLLHEPEGSLWRTRADLTISLRVEEKETHPLRRGAVAAVPAVRILRPAE
jgi:hypothetical protein